MTTGVRGRGEGDAWDALPRLAAELDDALGIEDAARRIVRCAVTGLFCVSASIALTPFPGSPPAVAAGERTSRLPLAVPLVTGGERLGTLELVPGAPPPEPRLVSSFSRIAALALRHAREEEGLRRAMEGRTVIGQAQGILMERHGLDAQRAFQVLARYSQDGNVKLVDLAREVIATRRLPA